ncbi:MAG TPA: helix-turn-helix domain-containing protein, partial [Flavobacterium sp.]|nr:helix-turn-helix domain-containing protein [Flavobacterium sp.]
TAKTKTVANSLFESLRKLRYEIAKDEDVPAYVIFSDAALRQMEINRPMSEEELITIDGVGKAKLEKYGDAFIKAIIAFQKDKKVKTKKESSTYKETLSLYQQGLTVDEIAEKRKLGIGTIMSHLAKLYTDGASIDLHQFVSEEEIKSIKTARIKLENPTALKPYFDYFEEKIGYEKIRLALAIIEKEENNN